MKFIILLPDGKAIDNTTILTRNGKPFEISTPAEMCEFLKKDFLRRNKVKSFTQWASELGETYTKHDALDSLASLYTLNVNGQHIDIYKYFQEYLPFKS